MPRLTPASPRGLDPIRRFSYAYARRLYGSTLEPARAVGHHRPLLLGWGALELAHERFSHRVQRRCKDLATIRTAQLVGCEWCLDFGSKLVQDAGLPAEDLRDLARWRESDRFTVLDRVTLEYAEAMTRTPVEVSDELFARLREQLDEPQIIELTMTIALENLRSRLNHGLGIEGQGFSEGIYCATPDRSTAALASLTPTR